MGVVPKIHIGVGGWTYAPWRGTFFPAGLPHRRELDYASRQLNSIEVNGTYYGSQKPDSFARWRDDTPDGFVFALKGPRFATNRRVLAEAGPSIERFFESGVLLLGDKLGPINWQFMPGMTFVADDFAAFLALLPRTLEGRAVRHAVEVRHRSFVVPEFVALARSHHVAIVVAGDSEHPQIADATADFTYVRIMGTRADAPNGYTIPEIARWRDRVHHWVTAGVPPDLRVVAPPAGKAGSETFLYVIGGHKVHNPAAAIAIASHRRAATPDHTG